MRLSLQLYTLREPLVADLEGTLDAVAGMGLEHVELAGTYGRPADELAGLLSERGLKVSGSHVAMEALEQSFGAAVQECQTFETEWVIVPYIDERRRNWYQLAQELTGLGERLAAEGLSLAYHNHAFELGPDEGLRTLLAETNPALVHFQLDLGWIRYAGQDPQEWLWEFGPRIASVHLKDMIPGAANPDAVAGEGVLRWDEIIPACEGVAVRFGAIEMDSPPSDPIADVRRCVEFFRDRGLA